MKIDKWKQEWISFRYTTLNIMDDYDKQKYNELILNCEDQMISLKKIVEEFDNCCSPTFSEKVNKFKQLISTDNVNYNDYQSLLLISTIIYSHAINLR